MVIRKGDATMVLYSSQSNVYHLPQCTIVARIKQDNLHAFESSAHAERSGYRFCSCCSPVRKQLQRERHILRPLCDQHRIKIRLCDGQLTITSPMDRWKIVASDKNSGLLLYHRNIRDPNNTETPVPKHHLQNVCRDTIGGYIDYIIEHDYYRMRSPLPPPQKPPRKSPKGSRRWKNQQKREKKLAKKQAVEAVYALLDSL